VAFEVESGTWNRFRSYHFRLKQQLPLETGKFT